MIDNSVDAVGYELQADLSITSSLGRLKDENGNDTVYPLIGYDVLPEDQTNLPAITYRFTGGLNFEVAQRDGFIINCFALEAKTSFLLAEKVLALFDDKQKNSDGFAYISTANMLNTGEGAPISRERNTPVLVSIVRRK